MDTSETYIKMCGKAEEIQNDIREDGNYFAFIKGNKVECRFTYGALAPGYGVGRDNLYEVVYLPRQDQLQEIYNLGIGLQSLTYLIHDFSESEYGSRFTITGSMEQLWLAFVEKEKYNKIWDGEDWVKEK